MIYFISYNIRGNPNDLHFDKDNAKHFHTANNRDVQSNEVPEDWEMFTRKGNKRVADLVQTFITNLINKANSEKALTTFCTKFVKLYNTKTMGEAGDTAVRESVYSYLTRFSFLFDFGLDSFDTIWEKYI